MVYCLAIYVKSNRDSAGKQPRSHPFFYILKMQFETTEKIDFYLPKVKEFVEEVVLPVEAKIHGKEIPEKDRWKPHPELEELKKEARKRGLWNLFLPDSEFGAGLSNFEYAHLAEEMGRTVFASEAMNCSAPDTGNMEVLVRYGSDEQKILG